MEGTVTYSKLFHIGDLPSIAINTNHRVFAIGMLQTGTNIKYYSDS